LGAGGIVVTDRVCLDLLNRGGGRLVSEWLWVSFALSLPSALLTGVPTHPYPTLTHSRSQIQSLDCIILIPASPSDIISAINHKDYFNKQFLLESTLEIIERFMQKINNNNNNNNNQ